MKERFLPKTLGEWFQTGSIVVAALSAAFAAWQYGQSRTDRRVDETFKFIDAFDGERLSTAQRDIDRITAEAFSKANTASQAASYPGITLDETAAMKSRIFLESVLTSDPKNDGDVPTSMLDIASFFNGLQICIEQALCDSGTAHAFFDPYAKSLWKTYSPVIRYARSSNRSQFAKGIERFLSAAGKGGT